MKNLLAQIDIGPIRGFGPIGLQDEGVPSTAGERLEVIISTAIGVMSIIAFIWFTFQLVLGGIAMLNSGGDKAKLAEARGKMASSLIGIIIVIAAIFIARLVATILGISTILDVGEFVLNPNQ